MRWLLIVFSALYSFAALPLPVIYDPFLKAEKLLKPRHISIPKKKKELVLTAIFDNKAFINGRFYHVGESVLGYKLVAIRPGYILLRSKKRVKMVPLYKKKILKVVAP